MNFTIRIYFNERNSLWFSWVQNSSEKPKNFIINRNMTVKFNLRIQFRNNITHHVWRGMREKFSNTIQSFFSSTESGFTFFLVSFYKFWWCKATNMKHIILFSMHTCNFHQINFACFSSFYSYIVVNDDYRHNLIHFSWI